MATSIARIGQRWRCRRVLSRRSTVKPPLLISLLLTQTPDGSLTVFHIFQNKNKSITFNPVRTVFTIDCGVTAPPVTSSAIVDWSDGEKEKDG